MYKALGSIPNTEKQKQNKTKIKKSMVRPEPLDIRLH
jgi:hypothetical protein